MKKEITEYGFKNEKSSTPGQRHKEMGLDVHPHHFLKNEKLHFLFSCF